MELDPDLTIERAPGVYPPRGDSHLFLRAIRVEEGERFLELGTGTGFVAVHAAKRARAVATDVNPEAVRCARGNAIRNGVSLEVVRCDLFHGLKGRFDVIASNPPYLIEPVGGDWEARAWQGGPMGEDVILRVLAGLPEHLADGGRAYVVVPGMRDRALAMARDHFDVSVAAEEAMFFETLQVLELRAPR